MTVLLFAEATPPPSEATNLANVPAPGATGATDAATVAVGVDWMFVPPPCGTVDLLFTLFFIVDCMPNAADGPPPLPPLDAAEEEDNDDDVCRFESLPCPNPRLPAPLPAIALLYGTLPPMLVPLLLTGVAADVPLLMPEDELVTRDCDCCCCCCADVVDVRNRFLEAVGRPFDVAPDDGVADAALELAPEATMLATLPATVDDDDVAALTPAPPVARLDALLFLPAPPPPPPPEAAAFVMAADSRSSSSSCSLSLSSSSSLSSSASSSSSSLLPSPPSAEFSLRCCSRFSALRRFLRSRRLAAAALRFSSRERSTSSSLSRIDAFMFAFVACWSLAARITFTQSWHFSSSSCSLMVFIYRVISWSDGNCVTCPTIHFTTFVWPLRKAAIRQDTLRLSCESMSPPALHSNSTTPRWPPFAASQSGELPFLFFTSTAAPRESSNSTNFSGLHQRRQARLCPVLDIGLAVEQQTDDLVPPLEAGQCQRRVSIRLDLRVNVGAHVEQQLHGSHVPIHGGQHERRDAQLTARARVDFGAVLQKQLDDVHVATASRQTERRVVRHVPMLPVRVHAQQQLDHLVPPPGARQRQGRVLRAFRLRLDLRTITQQRVNHFLVAGRRRQYQRREALLVLVLDVGATLDQQLHQVLVSAGTGERERGVMRLENFVDALDPLVAVHLPAAVRLGDRSVLRVERFERFIQCRIHAADALGNAFHFRLLDVEHGHVLVPFLDVLVAIGSISEFDWLNIQNNALPVFIDEDGGGVEGSSMLEPGQLSGGVSEGDFGGSPSKRDDADDDSVVTADLVVPSSLVSVFMPHSDGVSADLSAEALLPDDNDGPVVCD
uniref:Uncharacterized protein n=1 Tax=Anopheles atroparvus TaxID=41427 RepID=A0A182IZA9_ANOAO